MNPKLQGRVAHVVIAKWPMTGLPIGNWSNSLSRRKQRSTLMKPRRPQSQRLRHTFTSIARNLSLPANPTVWRVAPVPEEDAGEEEATPQPSEDSDSGKSYQVQQDDLLVSPGDVEVAIRVVCASEAFSG